MSTTNSVSESPTAEAITVPLDRMSSRLSRVQSKTADIQEKSEDTEPGALPIKGFRWVIVCFSLYVTCFLYGPDTTIAADVQGSIVEAFGHIDQLAWIGAGFPLGTVSMVLPLTAAFVSFDLKWTFIATVKVFEVGSVLCGAAQNMSKVIRPSHRVHGRDRHLSWEFQLSFLSDDS
ncbi:hypothetical protein ACHAO4_000036 [Trichoderma viride]